LPQLLAEKKSRAQVEIAKAANNKFAAPVIDSLKQQLAHVKKKADELSEISKTFQVKGRGHYSRTDLEGQGMMCEEIYKMEKDITAKISVLASLGKLASATCRKKPPGWNSHCCVVAASSSPLGEPDC